MKKKKRILKGAAAQPIGSKEKKMTSFRKPKNRIKSSKKSIVIAHKTITVNNISEGITLPSTQVIIIDSSALLVIIPSNSNTSISMHTSAHTPLTGTVNNTKCMDSIYSAFH